MTGSSFGFYVDEDEWILTEREVIRRVKTRDAGGSITGYVPCLPNDLDECA